MVIGGLLATVLNANRPAAVALVWITNPITIPPLSVAAYWIGNIIYPGPTAATVSAQIDQAVVRLKERGPWEMYEQFAGFLEIGRDIIIPLWIGGILMGAVTAGGSYPIVLDLVRRYRAARTRRRGRKRDHRNWHEEEECRSKTKRASSHSCSRRD